MRPMVLDDLGPVPTLRRAALDRGARAGLPIHFESIGQDRRLAQDLESGIFRILDDALVGYLSTHPPAVHVETDWTDDQVRSLMRSDWPDHIPAAGSGAAEAAPRQQEVTWRESEHQAGTLGVGVTLPDEGRKLELTIPLPAAREAQGVGRRPAEGPLGYPGPARLTLFDARSRSTSVSTSSSVALFRRPLMLQTFWSRIRRDDGQGLAEYALILGLIAVVAIVALMFLGGAVSNLLRTVANSL